jgi:predicted Zn-dependent peptidase
MHRSLAIATAAAVLNAAVAAFPAAGQELDVERHSLDNGLEVLTLEDHRLPIVSFFIFYKVGSRNEQAGLTGISHVLEHMMFNGAKRYGPKEYDRVLESNGGYSNAFTSTDMTAYYEDFPSEAIELIMDLESDRTADLALDGAILDQEREVVKEERRLAVDNYLPGKMEEALFAAAYVAHPYHWPVIGWMSDINNITREDCLDYFKTYYAPNNAVAVIVGDIDTGRTMRLMRKYFEDIPAAERPRATMSTEPEQEGEIRVEIVRPAQNEQFMAGYHVPDMLSPDAFALDVAQVILSRGESSRLHRRLVYEDQVALSVSSDFGWRMDPALYYFHIEMTPDVEASVGEEILYEILDEMKTEPVSDTELQKAQNILEADFLRSLKTNNGRAEQIGYTETAFGDYKTMFTILENYRAVTAEDVRRVMGDYFIEENRTVVTLIPEVTYE